MGIITEIDLVAAKKYRNKLQNKEQIGIGTIKEVE